MPNSERLKVLNTFCLSKIRSREELIRVHRYVLVKQKLNTRVLFTGVDEDISS